MNVKDGIARVKVTRTAYNEMHKIGINVLGEMAKAIDEEIRLEEKLGILDEPVNGLHIDITDD
jgi:hypothetical protein